MTTKNVPPPKRHWYQFSLRTLLVVVLLVSVGMSWLTVRMQRVRKQREVINAVWELGGWVYGEAAEPSDQTWLRESLGSVFFPNVVDVRLAGTTVTDAGLEQLRVFAGLQELGLSGTQVTDAGLEHLKGMTRLQTLYLHDTQVTDAGLEHLRGLNNLSVLTISRNTRITDVGLENLEGLTDLNTLFINDTQVTDAGLGHLKGMTKLRELHLGNTQVTEGGVNELKKALPNCKVYH